MNSEDRDIEIVTSLVKACALVQEHVNKAAGRTILSTADVYVVWFCKTLQNWKALVSTTLKDNMYYEVTYDGNGACTYLDAYQKIHNLVISDNTGEVDWRKSNSYLFPTDDTSTIPVAPDYDLSEPAKLPERKERAFKTWEDDMGDRRP